MSERDNHLVAVKANMSEANVKRSGRSQHRVTPQTVRAASYSALPPIDVAVGILMKPDGKILLSQRPDGKPYPGYWEFPGGKVDAGETILDALKREFMEELGVEIVSAEPWCCVEHVYPHAHVRLHFYVSREWKGEPRSRENQNFAWQRAIEVDPILPATIPLLQSLDQMRPCCMNHE